MQQESWFSDWQSKTHALSFDFRAPMDLKNLIRNYESFTDVLFLKEVLKSNDIKSLVEVGCATGEFYRYLKHVAPKLDYQGVDISVPAIEKASRKYPGAKFYVTQPGHD